MFGVEKEVTEIITEYYTEQYESSTSKPNKLSGARPGGSGHWVFGDWSIDGGHGNKPEGDKKPAGTWTIESETSEDGNHGGNKPVGGDNGQWEWENGAGGGLFGIGNRPGSSDQLEIENAIDDGSRPEIGDKLNENEIESGEDDDEENENDNVTKEDELESQPSLSSSTTPEATTPEPSTAPSTTSSTTTPASEVEEVTEDEDEGEDEEDENDGSGYIENGIESGIENGGELITTPVPSSTTENPQIAESAGVDNLVTSAPKVLRCRADDVVKCERNPSFEICEVQLCDGHPDCPDGEDEDEWRCKS